MTPGRRRALLDELGVEHVLLPGPGPVGEAWLGPSSFRPSAHAGAGASAIGVYTRQP
jgi:hypothetical protein